MSGAAVGYRLAARIVEDDAAKPVVLYLTPVDELGRKCGDQVLGTVSRARADKMEQGQLFKTAPAMAAYVRPVREAAE